MMNQKARFVSLHSSPRCLDIEDRYSNWMEGCVKPQHSRLRLVRSLEPLAVPTRDVLTSLAFTGQAFGVRCVSTALDSTAKLWIDNGEK